MPANWKNRTLWTGDNLDIMRGMNDASVDLIYLDPPFNSNRNYAAPIGSEAAGAAFKDTWTLSDVDEAWHGEIADRQPTLYAIIDAAGHAHGRGMKSYLIMMAVRLMEMHRLLKATGSIYLHCDPTASHYLKAMMDGVFGHRNFRNEIVWRRTNSHNNAGQFGRVHDIVLFYSNGEKWTWNNVRGLKYSEEQLSRYKKDKAGRLYKGDDLTAPNPTGEYSFEWRGARPGKSRRWAYSVEKLEEFWAAGRILLKRDGSPRLDGRKVYLDELDGPPVQSVWDDIPRIPNTSSERIGYPTQKPLALLDRIIQASSNEGDIVFDPFCGCATACVAAEQLHREWVGIDLSPRAATLVQSRLKNEMRLFYDVHHRTDIPRRTDQGHIANYRTHKHMLYGKQEGICTGCRTMFPFRNMTVDHIIPQAKGGGDHPDNLQLLCNACNSVKGAGSQEAFVARLKKEGLRTD